MPCEPGEALAVDGEAGPSFEWVHVQSGHTKIGMRLGHASRRPKAGQWRDRRVGGTLVKRGRRSCGTGQQAADCAGLAARHRQTSLDASREDDDPAIGLLAHRLGHDIRVFAQRDVDPAALQGGHGLQLEHLARLGDSFRGAGGEVVKLAQYQEGDSPAGAVLGVWWESEWGLQMQPVKLEELTVLVV